MSHTGSVKIVNADCTNAVEIDMVEGSHHYA